MNEFIIKGSKNYYIAILALFLGSLAAFGLEYCIQPILPAISETFSVSPSVASIAMSIGLVGMAVSMILIASFADKLKRKKAMVIALIIGAGLAVLMSLTSNFKLICVLRFIQGLLLACFPALALAYINEEFPPEITGKIVGIYIAGASIGAFLGRFVTSYLTSIFDLQIGLLATGISYLIIALFFLICLPKEKNHIANNLVKVNVLEEFKKIIKNSKLITLYFIGFAGAGSLAAVFNYISYLLIAPPYNLSQTIIGSLFCFQLLGSIAAAIMGHLADKYGKGKILCLCLVIFIFGITITLLPSLWAKILGFVVIIIGFLSSHSVASGWVGKCYDGDKARAASLYMLSYYIGASTIGTIGGIFFSSYGWSGLMIFLGLILTVTLLLISRYRNS